MSVCVSVCLSVCVCARVCVRGVCGQLGGEGKGKGGEVEARFRPRIQAPHGCKPFGALEYPIGCIEWPDYENQPGRGQCEEADQRSKLN